MANTGIHRKIDDLGRIVIPVGIRRNLAIAEGDHLEVSVEDQRIILAKASDVCAICSSDRDLTALNGRHVCDTCIDELATARDGAVSHVVVLDEPVVEGSSASASNTAW